MIRRHLALMGCVPFLLSGVAIAGSATRPAATQSDSSEKNSDAGPTLKVSKGSLPVRVEGEGVLEPVDANEIKLKLKVYAGELTIKSIAANGAAVKAGDSLLELDDKPIKKEIAVAQNELETAQANLTKALSDSDLVQQAEDQATAVAQDDVKNATDALKWFDDVDGPQMIQQGELQVKQGQYAVDDQNDELDQLKKMYKTEDLTSATADIVIKRALRQVEISKIALKGVQDQNRKMLATTYADARTRLNFTANQQNNALDQMKAAHAQSAALRKTSLVTAKQAVADAEQKVAELQTDAKLFKITSPAEGTAYYGQFTARAWANNDPKTFLPGEKLAANSVVLTVIKPGRMRLAMDLPEVKFSSIKQGMEATVVPVATGVKVTGKVLAPSPIGKTNGLELLIDLPEIDPVLVPGMKAGVLIDAGKVDGVLLVPSAAVADAKVWIKGADGSATPKYVITGRTGDDQTEIVGGLNEGDEIFQQAQK